MAHGAVGSIVSGALRRFSNNTLHKIPLFLSNGADSDAPSLINATGPDRTTALRTAAFLAYRRRAHRALSMKIASQRISVVSTSDPLESCDICASQSCREIFPKRILRVADPKFV
jgi:hypothetical protein